MKTNEILLAAVFTLYIAVLNGCNTSEGIGKDLEKAGEAIQEEAQEVQRNL